MMPALPIAQPARFQRTRGGTMVMVAPSDTFVIDGGTCREIRRG